MQNFIILPCNRFIAMDEKTKTQKEQKKDKRRSFSSQMGAIILGTTISLIVTIVAAQILENH